jgi:hypothetical protein
MRPRSSRRFDEWAPHPAAFSFAELEAAVDAVGAPPGGTVLDPFVGSGKAATFICGRGDPVIGIEAHPLIVELAQLKMTRPGPPQGRRDAGAELAATAGSLLPSTRVDGEAQLLRRFLPDEQVRECAAWRQAVSTIGGPWIEHLRWSVLGALRDVAGSGWPYARPLCDQKRPRKDIASLVQTRLDRMADDLAAAPRVPAATVVHGDARSSEAWACVAAGTIAASVSSPPYLSQLSYAEATRLELHYLGWVSTWGEMTEHVSRHLVASCTQQVTVGRARIAQERLAPCSGTSSAVGSLARRLAKARAARRRGKIYDHLVWSYFADLRDVLGHLRLALAPGARVAWVLGDSAPYDVYVDTPVLVGLLAEELGFEVLDDVFLRPRGSKWPGVGARHQRTLSERLLVLRKPGWAEQQRLPGFS